MRHLAALSETLATSAFLTGDARLSLGRLAVWVVGRWGMVVVGSREIRWIADLFLAVSVYILLLVRYDGAICRHFDNPHPYFSDFGRSNCDISLVLYFSVLRGLGAPFRRPLGHFPDFRSYFAEFGEFVATDKDPMGVRYIKSDA